MTDTDTSSSYDHESVSSCHECQSNEQVTTHKYATVRFPRIPEVKRSGHGKRTYANRICMAVEQSKRNSERIWKHVHFKRNDFAGYFDHDNRGKLTGKGARDIKNFLKYLEAEDVEEYQKHFGLLNLSNPFQGLHTTLAGAGACSFKLIEPFEPYSDEHLAEMTELYLMNELECLSFSEYTQETIGEVCGILNKITNYMAYTAKENYEEWSPSNIFRCVKQKYPEPYLSQFWFYNNNNYSNRKYKLPADPCTDQNYLNKWGFSNGQTASQINGRCQENGKEGPDTVSSENLRFSFEKFVTNGFQLGSISNIYRVHDLLLGVLSNLEMMNITPNFFHPLHQNFVETTRNNLGFVLENANIISSYWQWFVHRRITPIEASSYIHRCLSEEDTMLPSWFSEFTELTDRIAEKNEDYLESYAKQENVIETIKNNDGTYSYLKPQFTLACSNRAGYCHEPAYPNVKSVQVAAGVTFIKFMLKTNVIIQPHLDLYPAKDAMKGPRDRTVLLSADSEGHILKGTPLNDDRTITDELNKFMINLGMGQAWSGAATSSDITEGFYLGEQIALRICSDLLTSWFYDEQKQDKVKYPKVTVPLLNGEACVIPSSSYRS